MTDNLNTRLIIAANLIGIAIVVSIASLIYSQSVSEIQKKLTQGIAQQDSILLALAEKTDRNGADEIVSRIIIDCPNRIQFEKLLVQLGSISYRELLTTQQLFESCGDFYATRKGFMVARLTREYEILREYATLLTSLKEDPALLVHVSSWGALVSNEEQRSRFLSEQVVLQQEIITALIKGSRINSVDIGTKRNKARDIAESLLVLDTQIDEIRRGLTPEEK